MISGILSAIVELRVCCRSVSAYEYMLDARAQINATWFIRTIAPFCIMSVSRLCRPPFCGVCVLRRKDKNIVRVSASLSIGACFPGSFSRFELRFRVTAWTDGDNLRCFSSLGNRV